MDKTITISLETWNKVTEDKQRLQAENIRLREALKQIVHAADDPDNAKDRDLVLAIDWKQVRAVMKGF